MLLLMNCELSEVVVSFRIAPGVIYILCWGHICIVKLVRHVVKIIKLFEIILEAHRVC
jgi:hypothetical protein